MPAAAGPRSDAAALSAVAAQSAVPVAVDVRVPRPAPETEAAVYFAVSEGLADVVKHARADAASVRVVLEPAPEGGSRVLARIADVDQFLESVGTLGAGGTVLDPEVAGHDITRDVVGGTEPTAWLVPTAVLGALLLLGGGGAAMAASLAIEQRQVDTTVTAPVHTVVVDGHAAVIEVVTADVPDLRVEAVYAGRVAVTTGAGAIEASVPAAPWWIPAVAGGDEGDPEELTAAEVCAATPEDRPCLYVSSAVGAAEVTSGGRSLRTAAG